MIDINQFKSELLSVTSTTPIVIKLKSTDNLTDAEKIHNIIYTTKITHTVTNIMVLYHDSYIKLCLTVTPK